MGGCVSQKRKHSVQGAHSTGSMAENIETNSEFGDGVQREGTADVPISVSSSPSCLLEQLPLELLSNLLAFLRGHELAVVSHCSTRLYHAVQVDSVWQTRCDVEYGMTALPDGCAFSFKQFYQLFLYKYGHMLGLWQPDMGPFGGLIYVKLTATGILGTQYNPPMDPHVTFDLRPSRLFSIKAKTERHATAVCHRGYSGTHTAQAIVEGRDRFTFRCLNNESHRHPGGKQADFSEWVKNETNGQMHNFLFQGQELLLMKYLIMQQHEASFTLERLILPSPLPDVLIQAGLFKGNYGGHGIEILRFHYSDDFKKAYATKVTGDPNVPAGEISLRVDMQRPMVLTQQQQASISMLMQIDTPDLPPDTKMKDLPSQPFSVPADCVDRYANPPTRCKARFHAQGQIAGHGYTTPSYTNSHWIVFDEDTFGHIWLELRSFSLYSRVKEDFR